MITPLEPDILEWEVKWALGSITMNNASRGDGIPAELFQILKYDAVKVLHSICQQIWKTQQWPQDWKRSVFISIPKKGNAKECSDYLTIILISHASKVMLKILHTRLLQYVNQELPDVQAGFRKAEEPEIKLPTSTGSSKKQESSRKTSTSASFSSVQFSHVWLFATPWTGARHISLPITISRSLPKLMSIVSVIASNHLILCCPLLLPPSVFPSIRVLFSESLLHIRWPNIGASVSTSVLPMNIQDWFPLRLTGWISLQAKGLWRVFSNTTVQKHQLFGTQLSLLSNSHIHTWLLEKP